MNKCYFFLGKQHRNITCLCIYVCVHMFELSDMPSFKSRQNRKSPRSSCSRLRPLHVSDVDRRNIHMYGWGRTVRTSSVCLCNNTWQLLSSPVSNKVGYRKRNTIAAIMKQKTAGKLKSPVSTCSSAREMEKLI